MSIGVQSQRDGMYDHPLGKNPGDVLEPDDFWTITTQPFPEAHFAVYPEKLVERPIKTTPKEICNKCGHIRERILEHDGFMSTGHGDTPSPKLIEKMKLGHMSKKSAIIKREYKKYKDKWPRAI